jgi:hypothetical protein
MNYQIKKDQKNYFLLKDISTALEYGSVKADKRVQITMPKIVVDELDRLFPKMERSKILTQAAVELLLRRLRFKDNQELESLVKAEQIDLDETWNYLEQRDAKGDQQ